MDNANHQDQKGNPLRVGDPVSFVTISIKGAGYRISAKEGKVEAFKEFANHEAYAVVKLRNGRTKDVPVVKVRRSDLCQNELTEAVVGVAHG